MAEQAQRNDDDLEDDENQQNEEQEADENEDGGEKEGENQGDGGEKEGEEGEAGKEGEADEADGGKAHLIPKHRYDRASQRAARTAEENTQLREQLAKLQGDDKPATADDLQGQITELDQKIAKAGLDGDADAQAALLTEARQLERQFNAQLIEEKLAVNQQETVQSVALRSEIATLKTEHSVLDPDDKGYDQEVVDEVLEVYRGLAATEIPLDQAMRRATQYVIGGPLDTAQPGTRRKTNIDKNMRMAGKQPANLAHSGEHSDAAGPKNGVDPLKLSDEEFNALPKETMARMRGDFA